MKKAVRFPELSEKDLIVGNCHQMIKQLLNSITDLLATDKSRYFAQPRPIIVKYDLFHMRIC